MELWIEWFRCVQQLHGACSRKIAAMWMTLCIAGLCIRDDLQGVTSIVRIFGLQERCYKSLLNCFHSSAVNLDKLTRLWVKLVLTLFIPFRIDNRLVFVGDGIKVGKEGRKMPAVKKLHQESQNNSKSTFIQGHSQQALGLLVLGPLAKLFSVPLICRIHEGLRFTPKDKSTLLDKFAAMFLSTVATMTDQGCILIADAYYTCGKLIRQLLDQGHHLICKVRSNGVAWLPATPDNKRSSGRKKIYGQKVHLRDVFSNAALFETMTVPIYGKIVTVQYCTQQLLWRPIGRLVRFVWVLDPNKGRCILLCTDLNISARQIIMAYSYRFKIEVAFKQAVHTIGSFSYHFWMKVFKPRSRQKSGDAYLHREPKDYRDKIVEKITAYHRFIQFGCIAQGMLQYLSINFGQQVWQCFGSWMRTMNTSMCPSEAVVATALKNSLPEFLLDSAKNQILKKFIMDRIDPTRFWPLRRAT